MTEPAKRTRFAAIAESRSKLPVETEPEPSAASVPVAQAKTGRAPGKKTDPNYTQVTVYLRKETHNTARKMLIDEHRQFSDLVDELVSRWITDSQTSGSSKV